MNAAPRPADGDARYSAVRIRRVSLLAALADDPAGLREDWILRTVRGYNTVSEESAARYLRDDVPALAAAGIRVEWDARNGTLTLDRSSFRTDDPGFTEEESEALAMASLVAFDDDSLKDLTTGAWAKLAPIARRSNLADDRGTVIFGDRVSLDGAQFADLTRAIQPPRKRVEFYFAPQLFAEEVLRTIEPWAIVNLKGRWYVVGHDVDREDVRTYRMTRMVDVTVTDADATRPIPAENLQDIAERSLNRGAAPVTAVVKLADGADPRACADVLASARDLGDGTWEIGPATTAELVDAGLEHAGDLIVVKPKDVRDRIVETLRAIVAADDEADDATPNGEERR